MKISRSLARLPRRRAFIHAGTHKTGTTALQIWLALNAQALARAGIYVPRTGRPVELFGTHVAGHHNIAWHLLEDRRHRASDGALDELGSEITADRFPIVILTSEDFGVLFDRPEALAKIRDTLVTCGYEPFVVFFLRPQRGYLHSLYVEIVRQGAQLAFNKYYDDAVRDGALSISGYTFSFDYTPLLDAFAACFGEDHLIVRAYDPGADRQALPRDFLGAIGAQTGHRFVAAGTQNGGATYGELLSLLHASFQRTAGPLPTPRHLALALRHDAAALFATPFAPIGTVDAKQAAQRFAASNDAIVRRFNVRFAEDPPPREQSTERAFFQHTIERWSFANQVGLP